MGLDTVAVALFLEAWASANSEKLGFDDAPEHDEMMEATDKFAATDEYLVPRPKPRAKPVKAKPKPRPKPAAKPKPKPVKAKPAAKPAPAAVVKLTAAEEEAAATAAATAAAAAAAEAEHAAELQRALQLGGEGGAAVPAEEGAGAAETVAEGEVTGAEEETPQATEVADGEAPAAAAEEAPAAVTINAKKGFFGRRLLSLSTFAGRTLLGRVVQVDTCVCKHGIRRPWR